MFEPLSAFADTWKFRLRMAAALRDAAPASRATVDELDRLITPQTDYWKERRPLAGAAAQRALQDLNERSRSAFVVSVRGRSVRLWPKPLESTDDTSLHSPKQIEYRSFVKRALHYRTFIEATLRRANTDLTCDLAIDVNDTPEENSDFPIFGFQRAHGTHNLLLPDVDFFNCRWYRKETDSYGYDDKLNAACFVGSSTGGWQSVDTIRRDGTPRLRAAAHFAGNPNVVFRISNAAQCLNDEAKLLLMSQPYYSQYISWEQQLRYRFMISMDGNGATCSRVVKGLLSNSVLLKFQSPYELYYFAALRPGNDFIQIATEEDVEPIIHEEAAHPGAFKEVAESGKRFAWKYLRVQSVMDYSARLLTAFNALS